MTPRRLVALPILVLMSAAPTAWSASFQGVGILPGGSSDFSFSFGLSADGSTVVGSSSSSAGTQGFRWTSGTGIVGLGDLPGGDTSSIARDASGDGAIVVGNSDTTFGDEQFRHQGGVLTGLGKLLFSGDDRAWGISDSGAVIVGSAQSTSGRQATRWTQVDGLTGIGDLPGGSFNSRALGVSGNGNVIVGESNSTGGVQAFRWNATEMMVPLGDLTGGSFDSQANDASFDGSVIVGMSSSSNGSEAFRWTSGGGMVGLGDLAGGLFSSEANATSADGSIVVGRAQTATGTEAFIWDAVNEMRNLRDVLVNDFGLAAELTGWTLTLANGLSDDGLTIAGYGTNPSGNTEAWIATLDGGVTPLEGDANGDGEVDLLDLDILGMNFGSATGNGASDGDFNGDGTVDLLDLDILGANFGMSSPATVAPEPGTWFLVLLGAQALLALRCGRSAQR